MKSHFDKIIVGSFVLAVIILGLIALITYRGTTGLIRASESVNHTREVLENLEALLSDISDAEVGQRGYVITGRESFLTPYHAALTEVDFHTERIRALTSDNPAQQARLARLQPLVDSKLAIVKKNISLRATEGFEAAQNSIATEAGKRVMDGIRRIIGEMRTEEEQLLQKRDGQAKASARSAFRFAWVGSAASFLLLFLCFHLLRREIAQRQRAEMEIKALNQALQAHAAQLESTNQELEAFSYSVSHDLRAPLRHINGFVKLLGKQDHGQDAQASRYLKFIADSARQMGNLVDDLLSFSRMSRTEMHLGQVDLRQLVAEIRAGLAASAANRSVTWRIGDLPIVHGDAAMLRLALVNLLSNALKYTSTRAEAKIDISYTPGQAEHIISVGDNGVGFDMKYLDKLFSVFQRLHHSDQFEGTGIGLANVRRIIDRHGGRTWAEGKPDQGATFSFALPKCPPSQSATHA
ncbi:MAG: Multi-sensor signal transduction histidine kinase [Pedosphaera sp.]|nr:Multi-sensor signal transduction histidine kinase [Pedosphaera sp.]